MPVLWAESQSVFAGAGDGQTQAKTGAAVTKEEYDKIQERWGRVVKEPLFQFLKHGDGRIILELYANEQISLGKAAEAITEKFCLKLEPLLPDWKGCNVEE